MGFKRYYYVITFVICCHEIYSSPNNNDGVLWSVAQGLDSLLPKYNELLNPSSTPKRHMQTVNNEAAHLKLPMRSFAYGNIHQTAYYFADVFIGGDAPQRQSLILDTGSSVMAFPCDTCRSCGNHMDHPYQCTKSSTCEAISCANSCAFCDARQRRCAYKVSYMEGSSLKGFWYKDIMRLLPVPPLKVTHPPSLSINTTEESEGNVFRETIKESPSISFDLSPQYTSQFHSVKGLNQLLNSTDSLEFKNPSMRVSFGCHTEETELFVNQRASGIWGLEVASTFGPQTFVNQVLIGNSTNTTPDQAPFPLPAFSLCFAEHGGAITFGQSNHEYHLKSKKPKWTPTVDQKDSYSVLLAAIKVNDKLIPLLPHHTQDDARRSLDMAQQLAVLPSEAQPTHMHRRDLFEALVDSGTTLTYLPTPIYKALITEIETYIINKRHPRSGRRLHSIFNALIPVGSGILRSMFSPGIFDEMINRQLEKLKNDPLFSPFQTSLPSRNVEGLDPTSSEALNAFNINSGLLSVKRVDPKSTNSALNTTVDPSVEKRKFIIPESPERRFREEHDTLYSEEELAYKMLPESAPRRKSQAVRVENTTGEVCYFLPRGRLDLNDFPPIYLYFYPAHRETQPRSPEQQNIAPEEYDDGRWVTWYPSSYLYSKGNDHYRCIAIGDDSHSHYSGVLGSSFFINMDIVFDVKHNRIGFVESNCPEIKLKDRPSIQYSRSP